MEELLNEVVPQDELEVNVHNMQIIIDLKCIIYRNSKKNMPTNLNLMEKYRQKLNLSMRSA